MMLRKFLNRILIPEHLQPETVCWSSENPEHIIGITENLLDTKSGFLCKGFSHAGFVVVVSVPDFNSEETAVYMDIRNEGRKSIGLGLQGFGLVLTTGGQATGFACKSLWNGNECQVIMVNSGDLYSNICATFDPAPQPDHAEVLIQANRILAAPFFFASSGKFVG